MQFRQEAVPPLDQQTDEILDAKSFDDLCMGESVAQTLALDIPYERNRLEKCGWQVGSRKQEEEITTDRTRECRRATGLEADNDQSEEQLAKALSLYTVSEQQVESPGDQEPKRLQELREHDTCRNQETVNRGCAQPLPDVGPRVGRHEAHRQSIQHGKVPYQERERREDKEPDELFACHGSLRLLSAPRFLGEKRCQPRRQSHAVVARNDVYLESCVA